MLSGRAQGEATKAFASAHTSEVAADFYSTIGDLTVSGLGLGSYLGSAGAETDAGYQAALGTCVERGVNVIDTAVNYRAQASERALGVGLQALIERGVVTREQVVVCSKGGFNPRDRDHPERGGAALLSGVPAEEVVDGHCLHPRYLERMLACSRENLGLETIDIHYLHNPEAQLGKAAKPIVYERIRRAFTAMEAARERGEIAVYGVATWGGFRQAKGAKGSLDLQRLVQAARSVGGEAHGFRVVQLPFSLALPEAVTVAGQVVEGETLSAVVAARRLGLHVVTSGPLAQSKLLDAPLPPTTASLGGGSWTPAQRALHVARSCPADVTLVGMSRVEHVVENLAVAATPRMSADELRAVLG